MSEVEEILSEIEGKEGVNIFIPLGEDGLEDLAELISEKLSKKLIDNIDMSRLINNSKVYNKILLEEEEEEEEEREEDSVYNYEYQKAIIRQIITGSKGYAMTSDLISHPKLNIKQSTQAIRSMRRMNAEEDDIALFKQDPENARSAWILTMKSKENELKNKFKHQRKKRRY